MSKFIVVLALLFAVSLSSAQVGVPGSALPTSPNSSSQSLANNAATYLTPLERLAQNTVQNLGRVRVDKWKTDDEYKDQAHANSQSLQRNLTAALPTLIEQVRTNPNSLAANFKLYRNLNALYDVLSSFSESTGAFGSKDDYRALSQDVANLNDIRRDLADELERMTTAQDAQVAQLAALVRAQQQAAAATPPKKVIVDDNAPAKKGSNSRKKSATQTKQAPQ